MIGDGNGVSAPSDQQLRVKELFEVLGAIIVQRW